MNIYQHVCNWWVCLGLPFAVWCTLQFFPQSVFKFRFFILQVNKPQSNCWCIWITMNPKTNNIKQLKYTEIITSYYIILHHIAAYYMRLHNYCMIIAWLLHDYCMILHEIKSMIINVHAKTGCAWHSSAFLCPWSCNDGGNQIKKSWNIFEWETV